MLSTDQDQPRRPLRDRWRAAPRGQRVLAVCGALLIVLVVAVLLFDWNMLKHPIERRVSAATGREFHIDGNLGVKLGLNPRISVDGLRLGNLPGAKDPLMASAGSLQLRLHLVPLLLRHQWILSEVKLTNPHLLLEYLPDGRANWAFPRGEATWPEIREFQVGTGDVSFRDPRVGTDMAFTVRSGKRGADARVAPLVLDGQGRYRGNVVRVAGHIDSPLKLAEPDQPYRIDMQASAGPTSATAKGTLAGLQMHGFRLDFGLRGPNLSLLFPLLGIALPDTPPYQLQGLLTREDHTWHYDRFTGKVGDSDLAGDASVRTGGVRPFLKADLVSKRLDFDDLAGFVGAAPQAHAGETASPEQRKQAEAQKASPRVLPDKPFELAKLRGMDADVRLRARHVNAPSLPIESMDAHLFVDDAVLRLEPISFQVAGGELSSRVRMDARKDILQTSAKIHARGLQLPKLFPGRDLTDNSIGRVGGNLDLHGRGNSVAKMLGNADGDVGLLMGSGRISNLLLEYAGIDIAESLKFLLTRDRTVPVRCAFSQFAVNDGLMRTERLAFDTTDTVIFGAGTINLRDETIDLTLKPQPKDHSLFALRAPLHVDGTFKDPAFHADLKKITLRGIAAALLATLTPPAALLATFETGPGKGKDIACHGDAGPQEKAETKAIATAAPGRGG